MLESQQCSGRSKAKKVILCDCFQKCFRLKNTSGIILRSVEMQKHRPHGVGAFCEEVSPSDFYPVIIL